MNGSRLLTGWWPRSLRSRLFLILFAGLAIAYSLSFSILFAERYMSAKAVMLGTLEQDLAVSIAIIDRLPAEERAQWVHRLSRSNYQLVLGPGLPGVSDVTGRGAEIAQRIEEAAGHRFPVKVESIPGDGKRLQAHLTLSDGSPLTIDVTPRGVMPWRSGCHMSSPRRWRFSFYAPGLQCDRRQDRSARLLRQPKRWIRGKRGCR